MQPIRSLAFVVLLVAATVAGAADPAKPLRVLIIAGGCCHDYAAQTQILKKGIEARVRSHVEVVYSPDTTVKATFDIYGDPNWAEGYDVILHDECSADVTDRAYIERILAAHRRGTPAVNLHCAMHSYRWGDFRTPVPAGADNAGWFEMVGIQSTSHGPQQPIEIVFTDRGHPVVKPLADWKTLNEELYNNVQLLANTKVLASGRQLVPPKPKQGEPADPRAQPTEVNAAVVWANEYGPRKTRIFSTSLGHNNDTVADDRYLDLVTRGLLWAAGRLGDDGSIPVDLALPPKASSRAAATPAP